MEDTIESLDHEIKAARYLLDTLVEKRNKMKFKAFAKKYAQKQTVTKIIGLIDWSSDKGETFGDCNHVELRAGGKLVKVIHRYDDDGFDDPKEVAVADEDIDVLNEFNELACDGDYPKEIVIELENT